MGRLSTTQQGITFENPFLLASSPATRTGEMVKRAFEAGWGGAVLKTICLCPETIVDVSERIYGYRGKSSLIGLQNIEMISNRPVELWAEEIVRLKKQFPSKVIIASIMADGEKLSEWKELTEILQNSRADAIELNLSCPNGVPERGMGSYLSEIPDISAKIINAVKKVANIPVWAKLSPNVTDISQLAGACLAARADGIVAINTLKGFAGLDVETMKPNLNVGGKSTYGGFSGNIIKPVALKAVAEISKEHECYVSATGGISNWKDAAEFMLLGASSVQICTEVMLKGVNIIKPMLQGIESYMERHSFYSLDQMIGAALEKIDDHSKLDKNVKYIAKIDNNLCENCGMCLISCRDGGYQAIECPDKKTYIVNEEKCSGCGLCRHVCPVAAISTERITEKVF